MKRQAPAQPRSSSGRDHQEKNGAGTDDEEPELLVLLLSELEEPL